MIQGLVLVVHYTPVSRYCRGERAIDRLAFLDRSLHGARPAQSLRPLSGRHRPAVSAQCFGDDLRLASASPMPRSVCWPWWIRPIFPSGK
jgi:hypothetical protein